ncbi:MAG: nucleotidyltransferase family protein [bacterium]
MEVIVLAGGLGTRLQSITKDIPKPMVDINGKPFLSYLMNYLKIQNINRVLLSVGYKHQIIIDYFGLEYRGLEIEYVVEEEALGTGGAINEALKRASENDIFVLNGDTFFNLNLEELRNFHCSEHSLLTIAIKLMYNFERYGSIILKGNRIIGFEEKSFKEKGYINGGIYIMKRAIMDFFPPEKAFSFENFLEKNIDKINPFAFISNDYFIDIGIPEDYKKAEQELNGYFKNTP